MTLNLKKKKSILIRHQAWGYHKQDMKKNEQNEIQFSSSYLSALSVEQISSIKNTPLDELINTGGCVLQEFCKTMWDEKEAKEKMSVIQ